MRYNHKTISVRFTAPRITPKIALTCKTSGAKTRRSWLLLPLLIAFCISSLHGTAISYESGVELISSDASGVVLELKVADLIIDNTELDSADYHLISYDGCAFTNEVGKPKIPVSRVFLGAPPGASISVSVIDSQSTDLTGYTPIPVPDKVLRNSGGLEMLVEEFVVDRDFYRKNALYPSENAAFIHEGYVRRQRVAVVELRPVQYNPATKLLRKYSRLVVRVNFSAGSNAPSRQIFSPKPQIDREFEPLYQKLLLNYDDAKSLRQSRSLSALAPAAQRADADSESLKIFVRQEGIYRLDEAMLRGAGMDLSEVDPRTIKIGFRGKQVPIYIHGESDGKFDPEDYIEFFGKRAKNIYTRWDVYWLTWDGDRGMRMIQKSGKPDAPTAREITSFTSVVRFDEDHLHQKLQNVQPDPEDPDAWFESRDHWFWDGIENGASKNEATIEFPVYDLAQTMLRPDFKIELVGCTNYEHNVMISVNGHKVGQEAQWERQDIYSFDGEIAANSIQDGINELRITRIGSNPNDGKSTDSYPYQVYINWFEIGYVRNLMAVGDTLEFLSPEPKKPNLQEIDRYNVFGFLNDDIEIFQIDNSNAICRFKDTVVESYGLDREGKNRLKAINSILAESGKQQPTSGIPDTAYKIIFQDQGGRSSRYIAVTPTSVLKPERIERDVPSSLKDPSNQADYIIVTHPIFMDAANELADWRRGTRGGGFKVRVVDVTDIYDEFNYGMASSQAVKDFLTFAYHNWMEPSPAYVLIFGDATYDFLGIDEEVYEQPPELTGFIPTFYIWTSYGQTAADHWYSTVDGEDSFPDLYLGRITVDDVSQSRAVLDKIIANESGQVNGEWRKQIVSMADDETHAAGDENFQISLERIWRKHTPVGYDTKKIFLREIIKEVEQNPAETRRAREVARERIMSAFAEGSVISQYAGHGGRHVWAHEIIFSLSDIELMKEVDIYPFLLVLSCYNGFFDLPGELSMAEGLLRAERRGIVAMLSATRLTYGSGNEALNELLFDSIFKEKLLRIGQATAISKTRLLIEEGLSWLGQMQEYTLFGDPASKLNIADYEIYPQVSNASTSPSGKLDVLPGQMVTSEGGQPGSFSGDLTVTAQFPNGTEVNKTITAANGSYPAVSFDIPANMTAGEGKLKFYGDSATEVAVGGMKFSVSNPSVLNVSHEFIGDGLQFYVEVNYVTGITGIESVVLQWRDPGNWSWTTATMSYDQQKGVYKLDQLVPLSLKGGVLTYAITATAQDGSIITTEEQEISLTSNPNLSISHQSTKPGISYDYSSQLQSWGVNVQLRNSVIESIPGPVEIIAFGSNPDQDDDNVVDDSATVLGRATVKSTDWDDDGRTDAFIPLSLSPGRHLIFVWIDPEFDMNHSEKVFGAQAETSETDNVEFRILDVAHALLNPSREVATRSFDSVVNLRAPAGAASEEMVIAVGSVQDVQAPLNQPDVSFVQLPDGRSGGYMVGNGDSLNRISFDQPVSLEMKFDLASFRSEVKNELGLADVPDNQMNIDQKSDLEQALKDRISNVAIYLWHESAQKWSHTPSNPILDDNGNILSNIHSTIPVEQSESESDVISASEWLSEISVNVGANTPIDEWTIAFINAQNFHLQGSEIGVLRKNNASYIGTVGEEFYHEATGLKFTIKQGVEAFNAGNIFTFKTVEVGAIQSTTNSSGFFSLMLNRDDRLPEIQLDVGDQNFTDGDVVSPEPTIQALIYDNNGVDVLSRNLEISFSSDGGDFEPANVEDYILSWDGVSNEVPVNYWPGELEPGQYEVKFQAYDFNGNLSTQSIEFVVKREFELTSDTLMNYPNPFERETDITFDLTSVADEATVKIYTVSGRLIRTLEQRHVVNFVVIHWDGRDEDGEEVANGVYYYKVRLKREGRKDIVEIGKMMKLK